MSEAEVLILVHLILNDYDAACVRYNQKYGFHAPTSQVQTMPVDLVPGENVSPIPASVNAPKDEAKKPASQSSVKPTKATKSKKAKSSKKSKKKSSSKKKKSSKK